MGRTINYKFTREGNTKFTDQEIETFIQVRTKYTTGKFAEVWTCDAFYPEPINFFPHWDGTKKIEIKIILREELNNGDGYDYCSYIENKVEGLMQGKPIKLGYTHEYSFDKKLSRFEAYKILAKEEWVIINNTDLKTIHGSVKVQGNELNAALTYFALKELTMLIPKAEVKITDGGEFLLCPVRMKQGKAIPVLEDMLEQMQHLAFKMLMSPGFEGNILNKLEHKDFCHEFKMELQIDNGYGDMSQYINEALRNIKEIEKRIYDITPKDNYKGKNTLYFSNMRRFKIKDWYEADLFTRINQVNPADFLTYKMKPATVLDYGEQYYGLSDKDPEAESYKRIAQLQKVLGKLGINNKLEVLGEDNKQ
jgi:hypothetical protein